jgi:hypothetical protein
MKQWKWKENLKLRLAWTIKVNGKNSFELSRKSEQIGLIIKTNTWYLGLYQKWILVGTDPFTFLPEEVVSGLWNFVWAPKLDKYFLLCYIWPDKGVLLSYIYIGLFFEHI